MNCELNTGDRQSTNSQVTFFPEFQSTRQERYTNRFPDKEN